MKCVMKSSSLKWIIIFRGAIRYLLNFSVVIICESDNLLGWLCHECEYPSYDYVSHPSLVISILCRSYYLIYVHFWLEWTPTPLRSTRFMLLFTVSSLSSSMIIFLLGSSPRSHINHVYAWELSNHESRHMTWQYPEENSKDTEPQKVYII